MLRTNGDSSPSNEEAQKRVSFDPPKYRGLLFLIVVTRYSQGSCSRRFPVHGYMKIRLLITGMEHRDHAGSDGL
jgi:hypothetical protein